MAETWLSQEAYDRLLAELEQLKGEGRDQISSEIEEARAHGDLRENAEYHAAKDEQGKMEARIRQLEQLLRDARIGQPDNTDTVRPGLVVTLDVEGDTETYLLGSREDEHEQHPVLSSESPMGSAIIDHEVGDTVTVEAPAATFDVTITDITAS
ncbi:GreA/GreB family elongation factor [Salsipaludibacter albus]|uniref:GreA/GreB family elongation factor n=1 Tax=Salsipaludibacter albus TaxID=2849650 RepID=UPI001EE3EC08|nr:transcription elongation factor GreA [Salsipaludibacter albus]MBY5162553.1 transcription elongation factor GreA [Salsipaludibacter albus]